MSDDFPRSVVANRRKLVAISKRASKSHNKKDDTLRGDNLTVCGKGYNVNNLLTCDLNPRSFSRKSNKELLVFGVFQRVRATQKLREVSYVI